MKIRKILLVAMLCVFCLPMVAQQGSVARPKLVVGIVIDQMRWDYIYRYYNRYGEDGFKRLLRDGASCENTMLAHIPSYTAVGHTSIYTGSVPSINGISSNDMTDQKTGKVFYCTSDDKVKSVGTDSKDGMQSPRNLWVTTVGDELRLATNFHSKVIGVSMKDRAAILPAGRSANAAYWLDSKTGHFITSTYYMDKLPDWVVKFNQRELAKEYLSRPWTPLYDIKTYDQSCTDDNPFERPFFKGGKATFPIDLPRLLEERKFSAIKTVPMGNTLTFDMAKATIEGEKMGSGDYVDFLAVSCSATDYVGHQFGVNAIETEDTYLRLDKDLADFFGYLDSKVGKGNYTLFLTADHAAAHNYNFLKSHQMSAGTFDIASNTAKVDSALTAKYGVKGLLRSIDSYQLNLNYDKIKAANINLDELKQYAISFVKTLDGVLYAVDATRVSESTIPDNLKPLVTNGYNAALSGEIQILLKPGYYDKWSAGESMGTTHGSWVNYDLHIPLVFMGWGIKPGQLNRMTYMIDIAPTVAALLHIQMPNGCIGRAIPEVMQAATLDK